MVLISAEVEVRDIPRAWYGSGGSVSIMWQVVGNVQVFGCSGSQQERFRDNSSRKDQYTVALAWWS